jgi:hypothetical protein
MQKLVSLAGFLALAFTVQAQAATATLVNGGFEASWSAVDHVGEDGDVIFNYVPTGLGMGWTFDGATGVVTPKTGLTTAAEGAQYAFIQGQTAGLLSQVFSVTDAGNADLSFLYGLRPGYATGQQLEVYLDGTLLSTLSTSVGWTSGNLSLGFLATGFHTIGFGGTGFEGMDTTVYLDKVAINISAVPEPTSALMLSLGLGGLLVAQRRRQSNA